MSQAPRWLPGGRPARPPPLSSDPRFLLASRPLPPGPSSIRFGDIYAFIKKKTTHKTFTLQEKKRSDAGCPAASAAVTLLRAGGAAGLFLGAFGSSLWRGPGAGSPLGGCGARGRRPGGAPRSLLGPRSWVVRAAIGAEVHQRLPRRRKWRGPRRVVLWLPEHSLALVLGFGNTEKLGFTLGLPPSRPGACGSVPLSCSVGTVRPCELVTVPGGTFPAGSHGCIRIGHWEDLQG